MNATLLTWAVCGLATAGVIVRPWRLPEAIWAVAGAGVLVLAGLLPAASAWQGVRKGTDVYLFLTGMMLLAAVAQREGLFAWLAALAARRARGSAVRLFTLVYVVGTVVTVFMSNDATAVVLTPAVAAVARTARARQTLPYLLVCAFIANAASFVLPISNPANLVIYGRAMPPLLAWLPRFALPSLLAIVVTYGLLRWSQRAALREAIDSEVAMPALSAGGRVAAAGIVGAAVVLLGASALDWPLGPPTGLAGVATALVVLVRERASPWPVLREVSWGVLALVAGLFVLVEALQRTGVIGAIADALGRLSAHDPATAAWAAGLLPGLLCNAMNNLPAGLIVAGAVQQAHPPEVVAGAALIGIDLGPNLSVTGSLATILWLSVLRREGLEVGFWTFLRLGALIMPPALLVALGALIL